MKNNSLINIQRTLGVVLWTWLAVACSENPCSDTSSSVRAVFPRGDKGSSENFIGDAYHYGLAFDDTVSNTLMGHVLFEPGARSNWHTHPSGQWLVSLGGVGYHQIEGQPLEVLHEGDVAWCPPHVRHWHGASPDSSFYQLYMVPNIQNGIVEWMEPVSDDVYAQVQP